MKNLKGVNLELLKENFNQSFELNKEEREVSAKEVLPKNRSLIKKLAAYATATALFLSPVAINKTSGSAQAESLPTTIITDTTNTKYKEGSFIEDYAIVDGIMCDGYVVKRGDTTSRISEKTSKHLGLEKTTKYWPVIAYLNDYPRIINPKDIVAFPSNTEVLDELLANLKSSNWVSKYIQYNGIYKNHKRNVTVGEIIDDIFGKGASKDTEFVKRYIKTVGMNPSQFTSSSELNVTSYFRLTDWIPTTEELGMEPSIKNANTKSR